MRQNLDGKNDPTVVAIFFCGIPTRDFQPQHQKYSLEHGDFETSFLAQNTVLNSK